VIRTLVISGLFNLSTLLANLILNSHFSSGVDVNAATEHNIKVARIPGSTTGNAVSCAEMAIYLTLGLLRKQVCVVLLVVLTICILEVLFLCFSFPKLLFDEH